MRPVQLRYMVLLISLSISMLTACMVGPDYRRPEVTVPTDWRSPVEGTGSLAGLGWWKLFQDPVLQDLMRTALEENKDLTDCERRWPT